MSGAAGFNIFSEAPPTVSKKLKFQVSLMSSVCLQLCNYYTYHITEYIITQ
jgi:hypothetical protein